MLNRAGFSYATPQRSRVWRHSIGLLVVGLVACGGDTAGPPAAGSIHVQIETAGFLKPDGYDLVVAGVTQAVDATDDVTVADLEPGDYDVSLDDVPANCTAEGAGTVTVTSNQTVEASLTVSCTYEPATSYTVQFSRQRPDLETGEITVCSFGICPSEEAWDMWVYNSTSTTPRSVVRQNQTTGVELAHVEGVTLAGLTEAHLTGATFTADLVDVPFDAQRVILIRTDAGHVFALGDPSENTTSNTLTFNAALIALP